MQVILNCLLTNSKVRKDVTNVIESMLDIANDLGEHYSVSNAYNELRDLGVEIDAESVAFVYNEVANRKGYGGKIASTNEEIALFGLKGKKKILEQIANNGRPGEERQIGRDSQVVASVAELFNRMVYTGDEQGKSGLKKIEEKLKELVRNKTKKAKSKAESKDVNDILADFFSLENLDGYDKPSLEKSFNELKTEMRKIADDYTNLLADEKDKELFQNRFNSFVNDLEDTSYGLWLSTQNGNKLMNGLLGQQGMLVDNQSVVKWGGNIDWKSISDKVKSGKVSVNSIANSVREQLIKNGYTGLDGKNVKYNDRQIGLIVDYFTELLNKKLSTTNVEEKSNPTTSKIISDILKGGINLDIPLTWGGNVDWVLLGKMGNEGHITALSIEKEIEKQLQNGYIDDNGNVQYFSDRQIEILKNKAVETFKLHRDNALKNRVEKQSRAKIIADIFKEQGLFKTVINSLGKPENTQANLEHIVREYESRNYDKKYLSDIIGKMVDDYASKHQGLTPNQIKQAKESAIKSIEAKVKAKKRDLSALDRLVGLINIERDSSNEYSTFQYDKQQALLQYIGLGEVDAKAIKDIQQALELINSTSPTDVTQTSRATARIKEILDDAIKRNSGGKASSYVISALRGASLFVSASKAYLLMNTIGLLENVTTAFYTVTNIILPELIRNPKYFIKSGALYNAGISFLNAGANLEIEKEKVIDGHFANYDRFTINSIIKTFKENKGTDAVNKTMTELLGWVTFALPKLSLQSTDAGFVSLGREILYAQIMRNALNKAGYTKKEIADIEAQYIANRSDESITNSIVTSVNENIIKMKEAGYDVTFLDKAEMIQDLKRQLYTNTIKKYNTDRGYDTLSDEAIDKMINAAFEAATSTAKWLNGKKTNSLKIGMLNILSGSVNKLSEFANAVPNSIRERANKSLERKQYIKGEGLKLGANITDFFFTKFMGSGLRFFALTHSNTPLGFMTYAASKVQKKEFEKDKNITQISELLDQYDKDIEDLYTKKALLENAENIDYNTLTDWLKLEAESRQLLTRAVASSLMLGGLIFSYMAYSGGDDDENEDTFFGWIRNYFNDIQQSKKGRELTNRTLPPAVALTLIATLKEYENITYDRSSKDYYREKKNDKYDLVMEYFDKMMPHENKTIVAEVKESYKSISQKYEKEGVGTEPSQIFTEVAQAVIKNRIPQINLNYKDKFEQTNALFNLVSKGDKEGIAEYELNKKQINNAIREGNVGTKLEDAAGYEVNAILEAFFEFDKYKKDKEQK